MVFIRYHKGITPGSERWLLTGVILLFFLKVSVAQSWQELNNQVESLYDKGDYTQAELNAEQTLKQAEIEFGRSHQNYGVSLNNLAILYRDMGKYDKAQPLFLEALSITERNLGKDHSEYGACLNSLAELYRDMGQYDKAQPLFLEALANTEKSLGKGHPDYGTYLSNLARLYVSMGQYDQALPLYLEALENTEKSLGKEHPSYGITQAGLANMFRSMGQYEKSLPLILEVIINIEKSLGKVHPAYGATIANLAGLYRNMGQYDKALPLYQEALANIEKSLGKDHPMYGGSLNELAILYEKMDQFDKALPLYKEALANTVKSLGKDHPDYGVSLNNLAVLHVKMNQYEQALPLYLEAISNTEKYLGKAHPDYGMSANNLAYLYEKMGQYDKALPLYLVALENIFGQLEQTFSFMSENEKELFLLTINKNFSYYHNFFMRFAFDKPEAGSIAYDIELATKGMILRSGIQIRQAIMNSGDSMALAQLETWQLLRTLLAKQYSLPVAERRSDIEEVEEKAEQAEAKLTQLSAAFSEQKKLGSVRWADVQQVLQPGEAAVEFAAFPYHNGNALTDSTLYVALVLRKEDKYPQLVPLCEKRQLDSLFVRKDNSGAGFIRNLYRGGETIISNNTASAGLGMELYKLIWEPLDQFLKPGDKVYFSPSGSLHQVAFAALPCDSLARLSDRYTLEQLSTTAMLLRPLKMLEKRPSDMTLFGGMEYDAQQEQPMLASVDQLLDNIAVRGSIPDEVDRGNGNWKYLPGTYSEVKEIAGLAQQQQIRVQLFTGKEGTEENLKMLNGKRSPQVLHIATHGFFLKDPEKETAVKLPSPETGGYVYRRSADPLYRSGLLFSGANIYWQGGKISPGTEDGVFTAYEATGVMLDSTQLVVLSACETGLGEIKGNEGVFGLQRAFKAAGAEYLMMSLWKVPDAETAEFMKRFYTYWFGGKDIPGAFRLAQSEMKLKYPHDPYKWAAFVLIR